MADTTAASYLAATATVAGSAVQSAAIRKELKYVELSHTYHFFPIAFESYGPLSNKATSSFIRSRSAYYNIYVRLQETSFLFQRISVSLQRVNAVYVSDTFRD